MVNKVKQVFQGKNVCIFRYFPKKGIKTTGLILNLKNTGFLFLKYQVYPIHFPGRFE